MKLYQQAAARDICPLFLNNDTATAQQFRVLATAAAWRLPFPDAHGVTTGPVLNGSILISHAAYGITTDPSPAPEPDEGPIGVEALKADTGIKSDRAREEANAAARAELLKPKPDLATLRRYSGGGGLGESINEFYTPAAVARAMVAACGTITITPKKPVTILDPACGPGTLLSRAPKGTLLVGVELEEESARIAQTLLPHATIVQNPFEAFHLACSDPLYSIALVNPPYGPRSHRHLDQRDVSLNEHYFLINTLRRVRHHDGLMVALVNLNLFGGSSHKWLRTTLAQYAEVLHTVAVPEQAFRDAGAGVSTCIVVLRRYDMGVTEALASLNEGQRAKIMEDLGQTTFIDGKRVYTEQTKGETVSYTLTDSYDPATRLGNSREITLGRFDQPAYLGDIDDSKDRLNSIQGTVNEKLKGGGVTLAYVLGLISHHFGKAAETTAHAAALVASPTAIPFGTKSPDHNWVLTANGWIPSDDFARPEVADALQVAITLSTYLKYEADSNGNVDTRALHRTLRAQNDAYLKRHQRYDRKRLLHLAPRFSALALLIAHLGPDDQLTTAEPTRQHLNISGTTEEVAALLADLLMLDEETLTEHTSLTQAEAADFLYHHYCFNGESWITEGLYYSGNAVLKSTQARVDARLHTGVRSAALMKQSAEFLKRVHQPTLAETSISPRDPTVPVAVLEAWVNTYLGSIDHTGRHVMSVVREKGAVKFMLRAPGDARIQLNVRKMFDESTARDLQAYLNHNTRLATIHGASEMTKEEYRAERAAAMEEAKDFEERIASNFASWLQASGYADETLAAYNQARHSHLTPRGITTPLHLPTWKGPALHPYQAMDVRSMAAVTGALLGYDVGLGKTFTGLYLIGYLKLIGKTIRPCIVVPAGLVSNWAMNAALALPDLKILSVGMTPDTHPDGSPRYKTKLDGSVMTDERGTPIPKWKEDSAAIKKLKIAQVASGQADIVIMSREAFTAIPMTEENRNRFISTDMQYIKRLEAQDSFDPKAKKPRHDTMKRITAFQAASQARLKQNQSGDMLFEHLGIDLIMYDESQSLKNLYAAPSTFGTTPKFLGGGGESNRALDACHKGRYVRERGGRTYSLTASWVKNSPLEVHSALSIISDDLADYGLETNEVLMDQYLDVQPRIVTSLDGEVDVKPAVVAFKRLIELKAIIDSKVIIRKPGDPEVVTGNGKLLHVPKIVEREVTFDMHPDQQALYQTYRTQIRNVGRNSKGDDHAFSVMWRMRKLSADPVLVGLDCPNPRFEAIAREAMRIRADHGKTLVFLSIGEQEGSFIRLKQVLVEAGYPEHEIEIVTGKSHGSSVARQNLEDSYNHGDLTLIIGSEILAEGFNLQRGTKGIIHADLPWNFEGIRQRNGRGGRQGNTFDHVESIYMLQRGSFDTITYTIVRGKKGWQDQLDGKHDHAENTAAEFGADEIALLMSDDPEATRRKIAEKKAELAERTGKAALRRRVNVIYRAYIARMAVKHTVDIANRRKNGWTALDYLRVAEGRRGYDRQMREMETPETFPLAKVVRYKNLLMWEYGLPFHDGMQFTIDNIRYEITSCNQNEAQVKYDEAGRYRSKTIPLRTIRDQASEYAPASAEHLYDQSSIQEGIPVFNVVMPPNVTIQALLGSRVNPVPKAEGVISVSVMNGVVESVTGRSEQALRLCLNTGRTLIHYLTSGHKEGLRITSIVVLCPYEQVRQRTEEIKHSRQFSDHLKTILQQAVNL